MYEKLILKERMSHRDEDKIEQIPQSLVKNINQFS